MTDNTFIETHRIDHDLCDRIIDFFNRNKKLTSPGRLGRDQRIDREMKDSLDLTIPMRIYGYFEPFFQELTGYVDQYVKKYYFDVGATGLGPMQVAEVANIQWYPVGGGYPAPHCERDQIAFCNRALVWMLYLTDTPGGGTAFPHQDLVTECVKGDLLLWPSDMTHMHHGVVSDTHEKMIFTGWINFIRPDAVPARDSDAAADE